MLRLGGCLTASRRDSSVVEGMRVLVGSGSLEMNLVAIQAQC
jgi:hypothetical protein